MNKKTIQDVLPFVEKPSQYLGTEINRIRKDQSQVDISVALAFPDLYEIGTSHFGMQILYDLLNKQSGVSAERIFAPGEDMARALRAAGIPLCSLESRKPLTEFHMIGFSLLYELNYTNILTILDLSGIPFLSSDRDASHPLIIAGGPATCNPEPVAEFFDAMVIGEGENVILEIIRVIREHGNASDRRELLLALSGINSVYVPSFYRADYDEAGFQRLTPIENAPARIRRAIVSELNTSSFPEAPVVPFGRPVHDRLRLELARGCTRGCRFCQAGMIYRPVRERSMETILKQADRALSATGFGDLSLLSLSTGDYHCITPLMGCLMERYANRHVSISLPSLRAGTFDQAMMKLIRSVRKTGFTIAPEAGSQRLRDVINKNITHAEILDTIRQAFDLGWLVIKLYFMIGLPTETEADLQGIVDLVKEIRKIPGMKRQRKINVSISTFIPKPHVPFQWSSQISMAEANAKLDRLKSALRMPGVFLKWQTPEISRLEGLFARGDRKLNQLLVKAYEKGCRLDGWTDHFDANKWQSAIDETGIDVEHYTGRKRLIDEPLPWDHIDSRVDKAYLRTEYHRAMDGALTGDCRTAECNNCGVCDFAVIQPVIYTHVIKPSPLENVGPATVGSRLTYRFSYMKIDDAKYFGHLELMNIIFRAVSRAVIPVQFSEGFHPKPKISFGNPLPVGIESQEELFYLTLTEAMKPATMIERLNAQLPEGLHIVECGLQPANEMMVPTADVVYQVRTPNPEMAFDPSQLDAFQQASSVIFLKKNQKGKLQNIELKDMVSFVQLAEKNLLHISMKTVNGPSARVTDVIGRIFNLTEKEVRLLHIVKQANRMVS